MTTGFSYLKEATTIAHKKLENVSFASEIMSRTLTAEQYRQLILKNQFIYTQIEPLLNEALSANAEHSLAAFTSDRLADLDRDVTFFKDKKLTNQGRVHLEINTNSLPELVGMLYVLEGSRLGGNVIVKALRKNENLADFPEFHFYSQKNIDIRSRWMSLMKIGNSLLASPEDSATAAAAGNVVFDYFFEVFQN